MALLEESRGTTTAHTHTAIRGPRSRTRRAGAGRRHSTSGRDASCRAAPARHARHARGAHAPPIRQPHSTWAHRVVAGGALLVDA
jgi:hypothetical protein